MLSSYSLIYHDFSSHLIYRPVFGLFFSVWLRSVNSGTCILTTAKVQAHRIPIFHLHYRSQANATSLKLLTFRKSAFRSISIVDFIKSSKREHCILNTNVCVSVWTVCLCEWSMLCEISVDRRVRLSNFTLCWAISSFLPFLFLHIYVIFYVVYVELASPWLYLRKLIPLSDCWVHC